MGTRNLTMVMVDRQYRIAQYGQWDGYPNGQGVDVLEFARKRLAKKAGREAFKDRLARCRFISEEETKALYEAAGIHGEFMTLQKAAEFKKRHPTIDRDLAAGILEHVWGAQEPVILRDETAFAGDSLFCEWAYVIDLDQATLEVFKGFNEEPLETGERFSGLPHKDRTSSGSTYYPIRLRAKWSLDDLPTEKAFLATFDGDEE